uniref:Putative x-linked retinitis pigmentosa gtpase regulator n=1 Tax=Ixodes ricinus TaxID=34613 RepID=V5I0L1_IXORI
MKIQALPIIAVVAGLLSIVCGAPASNGPNERADNPEKEDRSCTKRDADARKAFVNKETVDHCNYFCKPYDDQDYYDEKKYPVGTKCKYGDKVSICTEEGCIYPKDSGGDDNKKEEEPGQEPKDEQGKENEKNGEKGGEEQGDEGKNKEKKGEVEGENQGDEAEGNIEEEEKPKGDDSKENNENPEKPNGDEEKDKNNEEQGKGEKGEEEEEEEGELDKESTGDTSKK